MKRLLTTGFLVCISLVMLGCTKEDEKPIPPGPDPLRSFYFRMENAEVFGENPDPAVIASEKMKAETAVRLTPRRRP